MIDLAEVLRLIEDAMPAWNRMKEDQKRVRLFMEDWEEAVRNEKDDTKKAVLYGMIPALLMKLPTGWTFSTDPFKGFRLLADDFARAANFERYKQRRNL